MTRRARPRPSPRSIARSSRPTRPPGPRPRPSPRPERLLLGDEAAGPVPRRVDADRRAVAGRGRIEGDVEGPVGGRPVDVTRGREARPPEPHAVTPREQAVRGI